MRLLLCSIVCSVLVTGASAQWYPSSNVVVIYPPSQPIVAQPPPGVVIRRPGPVEEYVPAPQVTYFIAFKNSVVRLADEYWVNGKTLYYVTTDHQQMAAPLESVDVGVSQRLNGEQDVVFSLPAEGEKAIVHAHVIHKTAILAHNRCRCECGSTPAGGRASRANSAPGK